VAAVDERLIFNGQRSIKGALTLSLAGWLGVGIGLFTARVATYFAYLTAFTFVASIALGALVFLMTTYVVGARWNAVIRRLNESIVSVFPLLALCFLPIAFGLDDLYLWANPPASLPEHELHALLHKHAYLNEPFFLLRAALYFVIWSGSAALLCRWSLSGDGAAVPPEAGREPPAGDDVDPNLPRPHAAPRAFSSAVLPLVALALTFASFDWLMSLQPFWMSSIFGVYYFAGGFVASLGLLATLAYAAQRSSASDVIRPSHFYALGRLMLGFTIFWAYNAFFQALLISLPNRPEEVVFYLTRLKGGWHVVAWALAIVRFAVPFFLLLPRRIKFQGRVMAVLGLWLVFGHYIDMYWLVVPVYTEHGPLPTIWDLAALCAVAGPCIAFAAWRLHGRAIIPVGDPVLQQSIQYRSPL
jgi:hypothetical protein